MSSLEKALQMWSNALTKVWDFLTLDIVYGNPQLWTLSYGINNGLKIGASALVVAICLYGILRKTTRLTDLKRPEFVFSAFLKLIIADSVVVFSYDILRGIARIIQAVINQIHSTAGTSGVNIVKIPTSVIEALEKASVGDNIKVFLLGLLSMLIIFIMSIMLNVLVWGRIVNLYLHIAVSGLFLSFFAAEETHHIAVSFLKSFANVVFRGVVIALAIIIYTKLATSGGALGKPISTSVTDPGEYLMDYMFQFLIGGFVTLGICKAGDQIAQRMGF